MIHTLRPKKKLLSRIKTILIFLSTDRVNIDHVLYGKTEGSIEKKNKKTKGLAQASSELVTPRRNRGTLLNNMPPAVYV